MIVLMILARLFAAIFLVIGLTICAAFLALFGGLAWIATGKPFKAYVQYPKWPN